MIDIKINITNKIANAIGTPFIVCGNSDYTVTFTFDAEWGAYQEKTARFFFVADGIEQYIDVLFSGNTCNAPVLPNIEKVLIGVYTGNLRTTTGAEVRCKRSILFGGKVHEPPTTEDVYNEILEIVGKKLGSEGGTVTGDYFKDGNTFIHEGNLDLLDGTDNLAITKTATGSAITIDSASAPLQNLKLFGKTEQNGTPTPSAPVPLVSVGDSGSFEVGMYRGKNFLEITGTTATVKGVTFTVNDDGSIHAQGTSTAQANFFLNAKKGLQHLIKGKTYRAIDCGFELVKKDNSVSYPATFVYDDTIKYLNILIVLGAGTTINKTYYPMILLASETDKSFEKFKGKQPLTMPYTLRSVGDIKDEVDFNRGVLIQRIAKRVLTENDNWIDCGCFGLMDFRDKKAGYNNFMNDKLPFNISTQQLAGTVYSTAFNGAEQYKNYFYVSLPNDIVPKGDINAFKTWIASNPITIYYELAEPIETPITETDFNAFRQIRTNKGNTTILCEADMELDYYINKPNAQAIGNLHTQINKDYFKLQQAIISTGGN